MSDVDPGAERDAVAEVRAMRLRDIELTEAKWARVDAAASGPDAADVEQRLLAALGLKGLTG